MNIISGFENGQQKKIKADLRKIGFEDAVEIAKVILFKQIWI